VAQAILAQAIESGTRLITPFCMLIMVEPRFDVLTTLAARLGYALRHAFPHLGPGDREPFLGPLANVLDDIGILVRPTGTLSIDFQNLPTKFKQPINLFAALASRPCTLAWRPPDLDGHIASIGYHLLNIDDLLTVTPARPTPVADVTTTDTASHMPKSHVVVPGPVASEFAAVFESWPNFVHEVCLAFARLAAAWPAVAAALEPMPRPSALAAACAAHVVDPLEYLHDFAPFCRATRALACRVLLAQHGHGVSFLIDLRCAAPINELEFILVETHSNMIIDDLTTIIAYDIAFALGMATHRSVQLFLDSDVDDISDSACAALLHGCCLPHAMRRLGRLRVRRRA